MNLNVDLKRWVLCGSYEQLVCNIAHQINWKLMIQIKFSSFFKWNVATTDIFFVFQRLKATRKKPVYGKHVFSKCEKTLKIKIWQNLKTQNVKSQKFNFYFITHLPLSPRSPSLLLCFVWIYYITQILPFLLKCYVFVQTYILYDIPTVEDSPSAMSSFHWGIVC